MEAFRPRESRGSSEIRRQQQWVYISGLCDCSAPCLETEPAVHPDKPQNCINIEAHALSGTFKLRVPVCETYLARSRSWRQRRSELDTQDAWCGYRQLVAMGAKLSDPRTADRCRHIVLHVHTTRYGTVWPNPANETPASSLMCCMREFQATPVASCMALPRAVRPKCQLTIHCNWNANGNAQEPFSAVIRRWY